MIRNASFCAIVLLLIAPQALSQPAPAGVNAANRVAMGKLADGAAVSLVRSGSGEWGLEIAGAGPRFAQPKPAQIEVYRGRENAKQLAVGYQSVQKEADAVRAKTKLADGEAAFAVEDRW